MKKLLAQPPLDRRSFVKNLAALGAGLATTAVLSRPARAQAVDQPAGAPAGGGLGPVISSDAATVAETAAGRVRGYRRGSVYGFKGIPYAASTSGAGPRSRTASAMASIIASERSKNIDSLVGK